MGVLYVLVLLVAGEMFRGVGEWGYRGGVMYCVPGVSGGVALGFRPKSDRCVGVSGMSVSSSVFLMRGNRAVAML